METQEVIEGWRGVAVSMGLGTPLARACTAGVITGTMCYLLKYPKESFRRDGSMRPYHRLSMAQDATDRHFLLTPLIVGCVTGLCT